MKRSSGNHRGFALLLTLILLMIAAVTLSQVARQSVGEALHALDASEALQRRWAVISCRATLLPRAEGLLSKAAQGPVDAEGNPLRAVRQQPPGTDLLLACELAGMQYELVFTDEQAKYNPTTMGILQLDNKPALSKQALHTAVRELSGVRDDPKRLGDGRVVLRPMIDLEQDDNSVNPNDTKDNPPAVFRSYGQLYDRVTPQQLMGAADRPGATSNLTCWGDGRLNLDRAPKLVIKRMLTPLLGSEGVAEFLAARDQSPDLSPQDWLQTLGQVSPERLAIAESLLVERSYTQGLWVVAHGRTRSWYTFSVREYMPQDQQEQEQEQEQEPVPHNKQPGETGEEQTPRDPLQRYDFAW